MRTPTYLLTFAAAALTLITGCTVKDVDAPALAGPSTFANNLVLRSSTDTLIQDGVSQAVITITATDPAGNAKNIPLRADITVDGVVQDFGRLNTKTPTANGTPLVYTAPAASTTASGQVAQTVTILVTPMDAGDFRSEVPRQIDIRLVPQGVILPINPNLNAQFTPTPLAPKVLDIVTFDASTTTNNGAACGSACTYAWDFGDGTTSAGVATSHQYRAVGVYLAKLTVTDSRGAQSISTVLMSVSAATPPPAPTFTFSPQPAVVDQTIFFNASESLAGPGRRLVSYEWDFGKGTTGSGVTVAKSYDVAGTYIVTLTVTDDAGAKTSKSAQVVVGNPQINPSFTVLPSSPAPGDTVSVNASGTTGPSTIVSYSWNFGAGSSPSSATGVSAVTTYSTTGSKIITLTVTDSAGRTATTTRAVTVATP